MNFGHFALVSSNLLWKRFKNLFPKGEGPIFGIMEDHEEEFGVCPFSIYLQYVCVQPCLASSNEIFCVIDWNTAIWRYRIISVGTWKCYPYQEYNFANMIKLGILTQRLSQRLYHALSSWYISELTYSLSLQKRDRARCGTHRKQEEKM